MYPLILVIFVLIEQIVVRGGGRREGKGWRRGKGGRGDMDCL